MKFNLKNHVKTANNTILQLLQNEMKVFGISFDQGKCQISLGDEDFLVNSIEEAQNLIKDGLKELKEYLLSSWKDLEQLSKIIIQSNDNNDPSLDNIVFLNSAKKAYYLSKEFTELEEITKILYNVFNCDIKKVDKNIIDRFNHKYIEINVVHKVILNELYRNRLLDRFALNEKTAQTVPTANLDIPMSERLYEYKTEEEVITQRSDARKSQPRYNPEYTSNGFYFVFQDRNRDPYSFYDKDDSPYPSSSYARIP